jgi:hypothetical protein
LAGYGGCYRKDVCWKKGVKSVKQVDGTHRNKGEELKGDRDNFLVRNR